MLGVGIVGIVFKIFFLYCNFFTLVLNLRRVIRNDSFKFSCVLRLKGISFDSDFIESRLEIFRNLER